MLIDAAIKALKPREKLYKVADRDGMYVAVQPSGAIVFRYDYRINGRRETLTLDRYGSAGMSLARAREKLIDAQRACPSSDDLPLGLPSVGACGDIAL
ncbi:Arm DNA-binding domain-containing protein [Paroceanicella profunda]|uniref:Arm DNA-binding domain-containing protein n=1 Tax=Paroceanicella profunda TaxID=2579971 RepID=UPI001EF085E1|nr:Arm DNA-binding domain-containing protein [Paroceanicella profunda]